MTTKNLIFVGINGAVVSLDKTTGHRVWERKLKGGNYVSLVVAGDQILAGTQGEIFCMDAATGQPLWHDALKGYGMGLMSIATQTGSSDTSLAQAQEAQAADSSIVIAGGAAVTT
jgi:outer membrane protein assembly factor BamB